MTTPASKVPPPARGLIVLAALGGLFWWASQSDETRPAKTQPDPFLPQLPVEGVRVFMEKDFLWDKKSLPSEFKSVVVPLVNRIHTQDRRCTGSLNPMSVSLDASKTKPGAPVFYVTCGHSPDFVNVYFTPDDLKNNTVFHAPAYYPDPTGSGTAACQRFAKLNVNNPATTKFDWGVDVRKLPDGRTLTTQKFTAQNSFGVASRLAVECTFDSQEMVDGKVFEITD